MIRNVYGMPESSELLGEHLLVDQIVLDQQNFLLGLSEIQGTFATGRARRVRSRRVGDCPVQRPPFIAHLWVPSHCSYCGG